MGKNLKVNSNFHTLSEKSLFDKKDKKFQEYRRKWNENPVKNIVEDFPLFLDIETNSVCNLKCPFCATTYHANKIKKGFMKFEILKKIIDEGSEKGLYGCKFNIRGEPLLHKQIAEFIEYAKKKDLIDVYFNTNLQLLNKDLAEKLIDAGLDRISISIEGYKKEVYEKYRVGGTFERLIKNLEILIETKIKMNVDYPKIRIQSVLIPELRNDLENYKNFWSEYADEVSYLDHKEMKDKKKGIKSDWICPELWQRMAIQWDGTILPCNHDDDALLNLGNIENTSIFKAWKSGKLNEIRKLHIKGFAHKINACDGCYLRDSEIEKLLVRDYLFSKKIVL